ncbi:hypothetical protein AAFF_G00117980 [Aldrovandia affinis]|uniref:Uncharacterized protein n=1 Tax=Aldrovandia affinis TaxID=143900 RepID=A0AAD7WA56_9TELE|nr:hypothetical protein AAFF_G00117980 [Aldrovandia affinis]
MRWRHNSVSVEGQAPLSPLTALPAGGSGQPARMTQCRNRFLSKCKSLMVPPNAPPFPFPPLHRARAHFGICGQAMTQSGHEGERAAESNLHSRGEERRNSLWHVRISAENAFNAFSKAPD